MGDEGVKMDTSPVFVAPNSAQQSTIKKREKKDKKDKREKKASESSSESESQHHDHPPPPPQSTISKTIRFLLLLSLIPAMYFVPIILRMAGSQVKGNFNLLIYLWVLYAVILLSIFFYFKRNTVTLDSFATQIMGWMIVTLGVYHLVDLPKMVDIALRKDVLYVWCSFTMIFNLVYFFFDDKDYQEEKRREDEKEERRRRKEEARKLKEAEKRKKRLESMMSPGKRRVVNAFIYLAFALVAAWIIKAVYNYNLHLQEQLALQSGVPIPNPDEPTYTYD